MTIADEVSLEKGNAKQIVPSIRHFRHGLHSRRPRSRAIRAREIAQLFET